MKRKKIFNVLLIAALVLALIPMGLFADISKSEEKDNQKIIDENIKTDIITYTEDTELEGMGILPLGTYLKCTYNLFEYKSEGDNEDVLSIPNDLNLTFDLNVRDTLNENKMILEDEILYSSLSSYDFELDEMDGLDELNLDNDKQQEDIDGAGLEKGNKSSFERSGPIVYYSDVKSGENTFYINLTKQQEVMGDTIDHLKPFSIYGIFDISITAESSLIDENNITTIENSFGSFDNKSNDIVLGEFGFTKPLDALNAKMKIDASLKRDLSYVRYSFDIKNDEDMSSKNIVSYVGDENFSEQDYKTNHIKSGKYVLECPIQEDNNISGYTFDDFKVNSYIDYSVLYVDSMGNYEGVKGVYVINQSDLDLIDEINSDKMILSSKICYNGNMTSSGNIASNDMVEVTAVTSNRPVKGRAYRFTASAVPYGKKTSIKMNKTKVNTKLSLDDSRFIMGNYEYYNPNIDEETRGADFAFPIDGNDSKYFNEDYSLIYPGSIITYQVDVLENPVSYNETGEPIDVKVIATKTSSYVVTLEDVKRIIGDDYDMVYITPAIIYTEQTGGVDINAILSSGTGESAKRAVIPSSDAGFEWSVIEGNEFLSVKDGKFIPLKPGVATVKAVNIKNKSDMAIEDIVVRNTTLSMSLSPTVIYSKSAITKTARASAYIYSSSVKKPTFTSSAPSVATVNATSGAVTAKKAGKAVITANIDGFTIKRTITVKQAYLTASNKSVKVKKSVNISAKCLPGKITKYQVTSGSKYIKVNSKGKVTAKSKKGKGKVKITSSNGLTKTITITVKK